MGLRIAALIFDLDGTLVDSAISIAQALNRMRARRGAIEPLPVDNVKQWVSIGASTLVRNALGGLRGDNQLDLLEFREECAEIETPPACLYEGGAETLAALATEGVKLAVCSNKPQHLCEKVLRDTGISRYFSSVIGGDSVSRPKPHPEHLLSTIAALAARPLTSVYVGDSSVDLLASKAAGVPFVLADYGYADQPLQQMDLSSVNRIGSLRELPALVVHKNR